MKNFTGTIDDFMNEHDSIINNLILSRINEQELKEDNSSNVDNVNQRLTHIKDNIKYFFLQEFGDWEIDLDFESFESSFNYNFSLVNNEVEEYFN